MAGLLARGSLPCAAFPVAQWRDWRAARRLQLRGQPRHRPTPLPRTASPCSLLIPEGNHPGNDACATARASIWMAAHGVGSLWLGIACELGSPLTSSPLRDRAVQLDRIGTSP